MWLITVSVKKMQQFLVNTLLSCKTVLVLLTFFFIYSLPRNNSESLLANLLKSLEKENSERK